MPGKFGRVIPYKTVSVRQLLCLINRWAYPDKVPKPIKVVEVVSNQL
jgi:hypothetical protein